MYYASECPNPSASKDYAPMCGNCKQFGHTTGQCNAPFNFNNRDQQMQVNNPIDDKNRALQDSPVNCIEVVRTVQTRRQYNAKQIPIQLKDKTEGESSIPISVCQSPLVVPGILLRPGPIPFDQSDLTRQPIAQSQIQSIFIGPVPILPQTTGLPNSTRSCTKRDTNSGTN